MVFFDGGCSSLHGINEALDDFASWSGLQVNKEKTHLYLAGVDEVESNYIAGFGFPLGSLPMRYLGLPLMSRRLKISEYEPLLDKLNKRFRSWAVKSLSFAGRVQLIASVISGLVTFWISTFLLPQGCIKKIEALWSRFLWSGNIDVKKGTKVSWAGVCLPKSEGGVGLRRFTVWNKALCLRFVWLLFDNKVSLWSSWHNHHHLRNKSLWEIEQSPRDSWTWKMILSLRPLAQKFLRSRIGNGSKTSFWFDNWTPLSPLIKLLGEEGPRNLRLPASATVSQACNQSGWILPSPRSDAALTLHTYLTTVSLPSLSSEDDIFVWSGNDSDDKNYSSSKTWEALRPREEEKQWTKAIWFKGAVPRNAFNMWVSHLNRLPTRQRLAAWGVAPSPNCCLCSTMIETRDHVLISCGFASEIWRMVLARLRQPNRLICTWAELLSWMRTTSAAAPSILRKVAAHASVYHIWRQRNNALHNAQFITPLLIFRIIDREVRNTISARRHKKRWKHLMLLWIA